MSASTPRPPRPARKQMNVRLPEDLIEQIDRRRAKKDLSRDQWVERCVRFGLAFNPEDGTGLRQT